MKKFFFKFKWSNWVDLATGKMSDSYYLLQGKRNGRGKVKFRVSSSRECYYSPPISLTDLEKLKLEI